MAKSYAEKQKWVAVLETIASGNQNSSKIKDVKVFGNVIYRMSSASEENHLDIHCTWPISDEVSAAFAEISLCCVVAILVGIL